MKRRQGRVNAQNGTLCTRTSRGVSRGASLPSRNGTTVAAGCDSLLLPLSLPLSLPLLVASSTSEASSGTRSLSLAAAESHERSAESSRAAKRVPAPAAAAERRDDDDDERGIADVNCVVEVLNGL